MRFKTFLETPAEDNNFYKSMTPSVQAKPKDISFDIPKDVRYERFQTIDFLFPKNNFYIIPVKILLEFEKDPDEQQLKDITKEQIRDENIQFYISNEKGKNIGVLKGMFRKNGYYQIGSISILEPYRSKDASLNVNLYKTIIHNFKGLISDTSLTKINYVNKKGQQDVAGSYATWKKIIEDTNINVYAIKYEYVNTIDNTKQLTPIAEIDPYFSEYGDENYEENSNTMFLAVKK